MISNIFDSIYWLVMSLFGWQRAPDEGSALYMPSDDDALSIEEALPTEDIIAYLLADDPSIYVAEGSEEDVASFLDARIGGDTWVFVDNGEEVEKQRQAFKAPPDGGTVAIAKPIIWRRHKCLPVAAGVWLPFYHRKRSGGRWKYKLAYYYKTETAGKYCLKVNNSYETCKFVFKDVTGTYRIKVGRRWRIEHGITRRIGTCG